MCLFDGEPCAPGDCGACDVLRRADESYDEWCGRLRQMIADDPRGATDEACANGHPWTPDTLITDSADGFRRCRQCRREATIRHRQRAREQRMAS